MSSYFDIYCKTIENNATCNLDTKYIKGTCYSMCPQDEVNLRQKENLVHRLELLGPDRRLVKSYSRSAADSNMAVPRLLRPFQILKETVLYLLYDVTKRTDVPINVVYDFVNDRLRAVRQDITIQRLPAKECIYLLEPMVRFFVYYSYKLYGLPLNIFDPVLNKKYLLECLKWCLKCFDELHLTKMCKDDDLTNFMTELNIDGDRKLSSDRVLMESLYILCNLDDISPLMRYINLPKDLKWNTTLQVAYKIAIANWSGKYVKVSKLFKKLCPLGHCALSLYLPQMQRKALQVMSHAYHSKQLTVPVDALQRWLLFSSPEEVRSACKHYGLETNEGVRFDKGDFNCVDLRTSDFQLLPKEIDLSIDYIFSYTAI